MNTDMGIDGFQKSLHSCTLDKSSLSIRRVTRACVANTLKKIPKVILKGT